MDEREKKPIRSPRSPKSLPAAPVEISPARPAQKVGGGATSSLRRPSREEIAKRAYEIYRARGGEHGFDLDDWIQAEKELSRG